MRETESNGEKKERRERQRQTDRQADRLTQKIGSTRGERGRGKCLIM